MAAMGMLDDDAVTGEQRAGAGAGAEESVPSSALPPASLDLPTPTPPYGTPLVHVDDPDTGADAVEPDLATLNARLGLLASLSAVAFALPAVALLKLTGASGVLWADVAVFAAATAAAVRLPVPGHRARAERASGATSSRIGERRTIVPAVQQAPDFDEDWIGDDEDLAAFRPIADTEVVLALMPMSVLKALVGFLTFLVAFGLRRESAATWWFGFILGGLTAGALIGVLLVGHARRVLSEQQMLIGSLWLVAAVAGLGALYTSRWFVAVVALAVGAASAMAKPSFDALVQRHVRESNQGKAFARFETRFQLMWVVGSFVPVVLSLPMAAGSLIMAVTAAVGAASYMSSRRALARSPRVARRERPAN
jgi:hypothetical protein